MFRATGRPKLKVNEYTFRGNNSFIFIFATHLIRGQLLKKRICSPRSKFFPLRVDPILKGLHNKQEVTNFFPVVEAIENQILQLSTTNTDRSELVLRFDSVIKLVSVLFGKCTALVVTKC